MQRRALATAALAAALFVSYLVPRHNAESANMDRSWALSKSDYPVGTRIMHMKPTNLWMDQEFGEFLTASFEEQGRIDGLGWAQVGLTSYPEHQGLTLEYAVSYFRSTAEMRHAAQSRSVLTARRLSDGLYGGSSTGSGGNGTYAVFGRFNMLVDQYCWLTSLHNEKEGTQLTAYCARQRKALTNKLLALKAPVTPIPTSTSIPTSPPTPTSAPAVTQTAMTNQILRGRR